jgi:glycerophosphoryl diester phosphodiesterase
MNPKLDWIARMPIAHRGLHDAAKGIIENTRSAFVAAMAHGFAIELDVQRTKDGEAVVFHDYDIDRLLVGHGHLEAMNSADLRALPFQSCADHVESLSDILHLVAGAVPLVIEIKSLFNGDLQLLDRVIEVTAEYSGSFVIKSFDPDLIIGLRQKAPHLLRGIVSMSDYGDDPETLHLSKEAMRRLTDLLHFDESRPDFLSWHVGDLPCAAPFFGRLLGLPLMTWTVRTAEQATRARRYADQMVFEGFIPAA